MLPICPAARNEGMHDKVRFFVFLKAKTDTQAIVFDNAIQAKNHRFYGSDAIDTVIIKGNDSVKKGG